MSRLPPLYRWLGVLASAFPGLSAAQLRGLAEFSFGMVLARSSSVSAVAVQLSDLLGQPLDTVKQRLREWYCEASAKAGQRRKELDVRSCFLPLLDWVLKDWPSGRLAIALDATTLGQRFTVLSVSVVYKGCAVPVAWKILPAAQEHAWKPEWLALLECLHSRLPSGWTVIVLADRGLYAKWLFQAIQERGWHPFMRVNTRGSFRPEGEEQRRELQAFVPQVGTCWKGAGQAFKDAPKRLRCTLLARWDEGYADPWLVLTDLPPEAAEVCWYGLRSWIEQGFKRLKSGGWDWQNTHMTDPGRAERLWLAMAVATWWCLLAGGEAEQNGVPTEAAGALPDSPGKVARQRQAAAGGAAGQGAQAKGQAAGAGQAGRAAPRRQGERAASVFVRGRAAIVNGLVRDGGLRLGRCLPEPWPSQAPAARRGPPQAAPAAGAAGPCGQAPPAPTTPQTA